MQLSIALDLVFLQHYISVCLISADIFHKLQFIQWVLIYPDKSNSVLVVLFIEIMQTALCIFQYIYKY